jgi:tetratricopeptide (TPR) repeat protein
LGQLAECQVLQNKPEDARKSFEAALLHQPKSVRIYEQYARLLTRHFNKPLDAATVLDRMCAANPAIAEAFLVRARYLRSANKTAECMRDLDRVFLLDPENGDALMMASEIEQGRGDLRRAKNTLAALVATYPRDARGYRALSWLHLLTGNQPEAIACLEQGTSVLPDAPELLTPLADIFIEQGDLERAIAIQKKLEVRKDTLPQQKYLRGRLLMKEGKWNEALTTLDGLRGESLALPSLTQQLNLLIAACHERRSDREGQWEALKRILAVEPGHVGARVAMGNALLAQGAREHALKEYQQAARSPFASTAVWLTYANIRMAVAKEKKVNADEWKNIRALLAEIQRNNRHVIEPIFLSAEIDAVQGNWANAIQQLRDESKRRPEDPRLWAALATMVARGQGTMAAVEVLGEAQLAVGDSVELKLARARLWLDDLFPNRQQRIAALEATVHGEAERVRLLTGLVEIYTQIHDDTGLKRVASELAARNPHDLAIRKTLYALALRDGDASQSQWREEIRRLEGPNGHSLSQRCYVGANRS